MPSKRNADIRSIGIDFYWAGITDTAAVRDLLAEYGRELEQEHDYSLALVGPSDDPLAKFRNVGGSFLLAQRGLDILAGGRLRPFPEVEGAAEIKRVFVRPAARGVGLGREITVRLIDRARADGFKLVLLDTLGTLESAQKLYSSLGFQERDAYHTEGVPGMRYYQLSI